jgi:uncharacterized glyoxalase superfamily protein PhnB
MTNAPVWPCLNYLDAPAAVDHLCAAFGFEPTLVVPGPEEGTIAHAELKTPWGGGVMLGSLTAGDPVFAGVPAGSSVVYVVVDDPDALCARATAAGCDVVRPLEDTDFGSRTFTVRDLEGNLWSFGTYGGT